MADEEDREAERDDVPAGVPAPLRLKVPRWVWGFGGLALFVVMGMGAIIAFVAVHQREDSEGRCAGHRMHASAAIERGEVDKAEIVLKDAYRACVGHDAELSALERALGAKKKLVTAEAERAAKEAAEAREREAAETFTPNIPYLRGEFQKVAAAAVRGDLEKAAQILVPARTILDGFKGTNVERRAEWRELQAQREVLDARVQPFLDQQHAAIDQAKAQLAAEREQDRRDGVKITEEGYLAAGTLEKLQQVLTYVHAGDKEGLSLRLQEDPDVLKLPPGVKVVVLEHAGVIGQFVKVRVRGTLIEVWTLPEALRDP